MTDTREQVKGTSVLLYSGGLDSFCMAHLLKPDILLRVPMNNHYEEAENMALGELRSRGFVDENKLVWLDKNVLDLSQYERLDRVVPNRNAHLVLLAAHYGETIYLGAIGGDTPKDKDQEFCRRATRLLDYMNQEQNWTVERKFKVLVPFKNVTKTQLVKRYLKAGGSPVALMYSYSCHTGYEQPCGECKICIRKWVAMTNNNIGFPPNYFKTHPTKSPELLKLLPKLVTHSYHGAEDADWLRALAKKSNQAELFS